MTVDELFNGFVYPKFQERLRRSILINFRVGGRPAWIPSFRSAISNKSKKDGKSRQGRTLVDTAVLQNSIVTQAIPDEHKIVAGTSVVYARIHDQGGVINQTVHVKAHTRVIRIAFGRSIPERTIQVSAHDRRVNIVIPQRRFLMIQEDDASYFVSVAETAMRNYLDQL